MYWFVFSVLALISIISPFQKGLYFITDFYGISIILSFIVLLVVIRFFLFKEHWDLKRMAMVILLPLCYLLTVPFAVSPQRTGEELIRWTTYSGFFILLYWVTKNIRIKKCLPLVFQITGSLLSFWMIIGSLGIIEGRGMFISGRFAGVFQYPNTFAMISGVFYLFSLVMLTSSNLNIKKIIIYTLPLVSTLICFIETYSRGMLIVLPIVWFIGLLLLRMEKQIKYLLYTLLTLVLALIGNNLNSLSPFIYLSLLTMSTIFVSLIGIMINKYEIRSRLLRNKAWLNKKGIGLVIPSFIFIIGIAGIFDIRYHGLLYHGLPEILQKRLDSISLQTGTAKERLIFAEDAFKLSKDSPIVGKGGGTWEILYKAYQQSPYISNKIHNGYLEWLVDTGWIGLGIFILVFGYYLLSITKGIGNNKENPLQIAVITGLLVVFIHSWIDFNFSFGTVWLVTFWLIVMGLTNIDEENKIMNSTWKFPMAHLLPKVFVTLLAIVVLCNGIYSFRYIQSEKYFNQAKFARTLEVKKNYLERAIKLNPYNTHYISSLLILELQQIKDEKISSKEYKELLLQLVETEPQNSNNIFEVAQLAEEIRENELAFSLYEKALELDHFNTNLYEASMSFISGRALADKINREFYAKYILLEYEKFSKWENDIRQAKLPADFNSRDFKITNNIEYRVALAHYILGDFEQVIKIFENSSIKPDYRLEAIAVLSNEKLGNITAAENIVASSTKEDKIRRFITQLNDIFQK